MLSEPQLKQIREGLSAPAAPRELVVHPAPEETALASTPLEIAARIQEATDGAVVLRPGDGVGLPGLPWLTIAHEAAGKIHYLALPQGPEQQPFLDALSGTSAQGAGFEQLKGLSEPAHLTVFIAAACPLCPRAVGAANRLALAGQSVTATIIDAQLLPELAESLDVRSVPLTVLDQELSFIGAVPADLLGRTGHPSAKGELEPLLSDPNPDVAEIAEEALGEIKERNQPDH